MNTISLFSGVIANGTQAIIPCNLPTNNGVERADRIYQATVSGTGVVTATVTIFGSVDGVSFTKTAIATLTLSATTTDSDAVVVNGCWPFVRATVANVTGTSATVSGVMAIAR